MQPLRVAAIVAANAVPGRHWGVEAVLLPRHPSRQQKL